MKEESNAEGKGCFGRSMKDQKEPNYAPIIVFEEASILHNG
jgi:hypothetical protein